MELKFFEVAVIFSIVGFYFAVKAFLSFRNTPDDILRAKIFLNKNFLRNNFVFVFIVGFLVSLHTILELLEYGFSKLSIQFTPAVHLLYASTLPIIALLMALLAYHWNNALFQKKEMFKKNKD